MSCKHGNWEPCEECEAENALSEASYERGKNDGWEACETCHGIVGGVHQRAAELITRLEAAEAELAKRGEVVAEVIENVHGFKEIRFDATKLAVGTKLFTGPQVPCSASNVALEGWQIVPKEPNQSMCDAAVREYSDWTMHSGGDPHERQGYRKIYRAMLIAAPQPVRQNSPEALE